MEENNKNKNLRNKLLFSIEKVSTHLLKAKVQVPTNIVKKVYDQTITLYKKKTVLYGCKTKTVPSEYLEKNFKKGIIDNVKNYLFKNIILDFLMEQIKNRKILLTNYARLTNVIFHSNMQVDYNFNLSIADNLELKEWKNFIFRAPKRKRYKDLDKQVALFLKLETTLFKKHKKEIIEEGDWVFFETELLDEKEKSPIKEYKGNFWIKINNKYIAKPFQTELIGKKIGNSFITNTIPIKNDFAQESKTDKYPFLVKIKAITKGLNLSIDAFRNTFRLKNKQEVHTKLIEVFSYRNDISQRKSIIEELFHLLLSKHRFEIPKHFIIRRQEDLLTSLKKHPDYQVYKQQKEFNSQICMLAEKQLKEEILIDQIAYKEEITADHKDIQNYLYLFNNNRLKEFVYFKPLLEKIDETETPIHSSYLKQLALREKTLNHIIYNLTK